MKKVFIVLVFLIFLTSCSNETMQGYLTVKCEKKEVYNETTNINTVYIKHKDNNIVNLKYSYRYEVLNSAILNSYKQSLLSQANNYKNSSIIITNNEGDNYFDIIYEIDVLQATDEIKNQFDIQELASNQIRTYEEVGYICK